MPNQLPTADPYLPGHGDPSYGVTHYELDLAYDLVGNRLDGVATLSVVVREPTRRLVLDLAHLTVGKVRVTGARLQRYRQRDDRLVLELAETVQPGSELTLRIPYGGRPEPIIDEHHGDAGWEELDDGVIVAAQPHGAPTWFPCNDRPDDKATYAITVETAPGYHVASNGDLVDRRRKAGSEVWSYAMREPMATYLATVQIGRYNITPDPVDERVRTIAPAGIDLSGSFDRQGAMMAAFERWFGPYPFATYAAVVTADDLEIPLESQSLSTFGQNFVTDEWSHHRLVAHELSHQWFGNAVTMARMQDIWLHEGFACYSEWLWSEAAGGPRTCEEWARHYYEKYAGAPRDLVLADPGAALMFDDRVYKRGALTLHALRVAVGDETFFEILRDWVAVHRGDSVTTEDFLAHAGARTKVDVAVLLEPWLRETEMPPYPSAGK